MALGATKWLGKIAIDRVKERVEDEAREKTKQIVDMVLAPIIGPQAKAVEEMTAEELKQIIVDALIGQGIFTKDEANRLANESLGRVKEEIKNLSINVDSLRDYINTSVRELYEHISAAMADQLDEFKVGLSSELQAMNREQATKIISAINDQLAPFKEIPETIVTTTRETKKIAGETRQELDMMFAWIQTHLSNVNMGEPRTVVILPAATSGPLQLGAPTLELTVKTSVQLPPSIEQRLKENLDQIRNLKALPAELVRKHRKTLERIGTYYFSKGMMQEALEAYNYVIEIDPDCAEAWSGKGAVLATLGRVENAVKCYDEAVRLDPKLALGWSNRGDALAKLGRLEEALEGYDEALRIDPKDTATWNSKGLAIDGLGRSEEAIKCYDKGLEIDQNDPIIWYNKGLSLANLDRLEEAVKCYDKAIGIDPKYAHAWNNKGTALAALDRWEEALTCYDEATKADPRYACAWFAKGWILAHFHRFEEALVCCDEALKTYPADAALLSMKGSVLHKLGRSDEAIGYHNQAIRIDPKNAELRLDKGRTLYDLGRFMGAAKCYDEALTIDPENASAWTNKGDALDRLGKSEDAVRCFDEALRIDPENELAIRFRDAVEMKLNLRGIVVGHLTREAVPARPVTPASTVSAPAIKYCVECGTKLPGRMAYCSKCGLRQPD